MTIDDRTPATDPPQRSSAGGAARLAGRRASLGIAALLVAALLGVVGALAVTIAARGEFELATTLAQLAIAGTLLSFLAEPPP